MTAGRLHERVAFDAPTENPDGYGGVEIGWTEQFTTRAEYKFGSSREAMEAAALEGHQTVTVRIRASQRAVLVDTGWRMRDARTGDIFNIEGRFRQVNRQFVEITAIRGKAT